MSGAMGGPLTAGDLKTHQHATECHSAALVTLPYCWSALFSHALRRGLLVTGVGDQITHSSASWPTLHS